MALKLKKLSMVLAIAGLGASISTSAHAVYWSTPMDVSNSTNSVNNNTNQKISDMQQEIARAINEFKDKMVDEWKKYNKEGDNKNYSIANSGQVKAEGDGLSKPSEVNSTINDAFKNVSTVPDAIKAAVAANQKVRLDEQANLAVYLDSAVGTVPCKGGGTCTILKYLQEQVATQVDTLQKDVVDAGAYWLDPANKMAAPSRFNDMIYKIGFSDKIGKDPQAVSGFLSPAPMVPAGFEPDYSKGALTPARAKVLGDALVGLSDFRSYMDSNDLRAAPSGRIVQAKIMTRFARMQLARHAIMQVNHKSVSDAMNVEFKACVIRPNKDDALKAHENQHLVNIQQLLKCTNLSLMHLRRIQMEQSRLLGAMLATQLDQWAFSTSAEEGDTINYVPVQ